MLMPAQAAARTWDAVVVGAGPAGSVAAHAIARQGRAVLLVDRCQFPRQKTCGCCVSAAALTLLARAGLHDVAAGSPALTEFRLMAGNRRMSLPLPGGVSMSRELFDAALVTRAQAAGAEFVSGAEASLGACDGGSRTLHIAGYAVRARVVLAADGLSGRLLDGEPSCRPEAHPRSRIGVSAILQEVPEWCEPGVITMVCGPEGYAGFVRLEDQRLNVAAALAPRAVAAHHGAGGAVASLMRGAGLPALELSQAIWHGVPALTRRRRRVAADRVLALGDAAGYVEPLTGEGMAWAIASGLESAPFAVEGMERWTADLEARWVQRYRRVIMGRQGMCRAITTLVRSPALTRALIRLLSWWPELASPALAHMQTW